MTNLAEFSAKLAATIFAAISTTYSENKESRALTSLPKTGIERQTKNYMVC